MHREGYFAGGDSARLADLVEAIDDDTVDGIWCLRGGYGAMRLLPYLSVERITRANKPLLGYSDITALHSAWQMGGVVSYHGPTARAVLTDFSREALRSVICASDEVKLFHEAAESVNAGVATGRIVGGNLALLAAMCGTPWEMDMRGAIVVIEDIGEATYRLDRMLTQLRLAGAFDACAAIVFGQFTDCPESTEDGARTLRSLIVEFAGMVNVPVLAGVPVGHISDQWTLPFGKSATLDTSKRTLTIQASLNTTAD
jgi:muramoyltetrapeptide carboxypeptidase